MTFGVRHFFAAARGASIPKGAEFGLARYSAWPLWAQKIYDVAFNEHYAHALELLIAVVFTLLVYPHVAPRAHSLEVGWIATVFAFNFAVEVATFGGWHWFVYDGPFAAKLAPFKFNKASAYRGADADPRTLPREVVLTTLGFAQASALQCAVMHLWATGRAPVATGAFWATPLLNVGGLWLVNHWRASHFYAVHRLMHPWRGAGVPAALDAGALLYRLVHSVHHRSYNPGPWSGLAMHPVEHFLYFSCAWVCFAAPLHPIHFFFILYHALVSPVGGHDGHEDPGGGGSGYHWL